MVAGSNREGDVFASSLLDDGAHVYLLPVDQDASMEKCSLMGRIGVHHGDEQSPHEFGDGRHPTGIDLSFQEGDGMGIPDLYFGHGEYLLSWFRLSLGVA